MNKNSEVWVWVRDASNTHSFYSGKSVFLFKIIGLKSLNSFNLSWFLRNVAVCSEQLTLFSCLFVYQYFVLFSGTFIGFREVTIMYACHSITAAEDLESSTAQKTNLRIRIPHMTYTYVLSCLCSDIFTYPCIRRVFFFSKSPVSRSRIHYFRVHCLS